jgi:kexin
MRRTRPTDAIRTPALALALAAAALAGCGGGGSGAAAPPAEAAAPAPGAPAPGTPTAGAPAPTPAPAPAPAAGAVTAGPGCTLQYLLTASPLLSGADPLLGQQWHLRNLGQNGATPGEDLRVVPAWTTTRGAGVRVAVVDDAIEVTHAELRPNLVEGASRSYRAGNPNPAWPLPCVAGESHGTAVAGLVAARDDNAVGGAGVAPRASLVAFDALSSGLDTDIADALTRANDVNLVYQNSWGSPDDGALHPAEAAFTEAIRSGTANGRGGLGSVFVFSGGNGGCYARRNVVGRPCVDDDSNYDGYVNQRGVVAVCAVDDAGRRPSYGEGGANLTVCAPSSGTRSGITTIALDNRTRTDFGGTSAAAPMVSGVVALMLAANPRLTWRDVRLILAKTARQNDPTDPGWTAGFGHRFNHLYGFGVVDAQAAVAEAGRWTSVGGSASLTTCGPYVRTPNLALRDPLAGGTLQPVSDAIAVGNCAITQIEWVELRLTAPHAYSGDLRVRLTSPAGQVSRLADGRVCAGGCGAYADWRFGSMRHLAEPAAGTWSLEVADTAADDVGTLASWSLVIHGR